MCRGLSKDLQKSLGLSVLCLILARSETDDFKLKMEWTNVQLSFMKLESLLKVLSFDKVNIVVITVSGLTIWARWVRQIHRKIWPQCSVVKMFVLIIWWKHCVNVSTYFLWLLSENNTIFMKDNPLFIRGSSKLSQGKTILWTHICVVEFSSSFGYIQAL